MRGDIVSGGGPHVRAVLIVLGGCLLLAGCEQPQPRSFIEFMDDEIARDGTLARCNRDREATANDIECMNARRAAAVVATREDAARRRQLELESERKRAALRAQIAARQEAEARAAAAAAAAEQAAYDARWSDVGQNLDDVPVPITPVTLPAAARAFPPVSAPSEQPGLVEIDVEIAPLPELPAAAAEVPAEAVIPRPFRDQADSAAAR